MAKLTLQEQLLKAGLVTSKKAAKVERTAKKSRVQAREARAAVEENKKADKAFTPHPAVVHYYQRIFSLLAWYAICSPIKLETK